MIAPAVVWTDVAKVLGGHAVLRGFELEIPAHTISAMLGPNGAGKTTALTLACGLRAPDRGSVRVLDRDPREARRGHPLRIGVTPQQLSFPPTVRVHELIRFVRAHYARPLGADEILRRFDLVQLADRLAGGLSGGEARRLGLALAMCGRPEVLILDEPTAGLDLESRQLLWSELRSTVETGTTILMTTHDLAESDELATFIAVVSDGRVAVSGVAERIRAQLGVVQLTAEVAIEQLPALLSLAGRLRLPLDVTEQPSAASVRAALPSATADDVVAALVTGIPGLHRLRVRDLPLAELLSTGAWRNTVAQSPAERGPA